MWKFLSSAVLVTIAAVAFGCVVVVPEILIEDDSCTFANDGECDDASYSIATTSVCAEGTDWSDCNPSDPNPTWIEVCNYLNNFEGITQIYTRGPGEADWTTELDGWLAYGDCINTAELWSGTWEMGAYDEDNYYYCATVALTSSAYGVWEVDYSYECD
jgi:hypothetical protein